MDEPTLVDRIICAAALAWKDDGEVLATGIGIVPRLAASLCMASINRELADYALPLRAHVNLIPLNPTPGYAVRGTPPAQVRAFADLLGELGVNATVRRTRGTDIDAACGQLRATHAGGFRRRGCARHPASSRCAAAPRLLPRSRA